MSRPKILLTGAGGQVGWELRRTLAPLGDVVALLDYDSSWNHGYLRGAIGIGVIGQGDSPRAGHGPGITLLMTSPQTGINPVVTPGVNLKSVFNLQD